MEFIEIGIEEDFWVLELDTKNHGINVYIRKRGAYSNAISYFNVP